MASCKNCGSSEVDNDNAHGYSICMGCGNVLEDQMIVSEMQFSEGNGGRHHMVGALVGDDGTIIGGASLPNKFGCHKNYHRRIIENATRVMNCIANKLKLTQQHIQSAVMFYKMALSKRILQGKRTAHICAACLYIVCRTERTPHILLDFSEIIHENMFQLVKVYTRLCHALCIKLPAADPCLFINRYAQRLQLGQLTDPISVTAMRLVSRMKRDWMATGRRPSSLCGAALVVACKLHGISRHTSDIARIVRNSSCTIGRRLKEFSQTASSKLSIEEFENVDLGEEEDPPAFKASKIKSKLKEEQILETEKEIALYKEKLEHDIPEGNAEGNIYKTPDFDPGTHVPHSSGSIALTTAYGPIPDYVGAASRQPVLTTLETVKTPSDSDSVKEKTPENVKEDPDEGFSDVNDEEIDSLILNKREIEIKQRMWDETDHDQFIEEREKKRAEKEEEEKKKPKRKYTRAKPHPSQNQKVSRTPGEAMEKMIKEKKLSTKINYDVLKNLGTETQAAIARVRRDTECSEVDVKRQRYDTDTSDSGRRTRYNTENSEPDLNMMRMRSDTGCESVLSQDEEDVIKGGFVADEDDYFGGNYSTGMALSDAINTYGDESE